MRRDQPRYSREHNAMLPAIMHRSGNRLERFTHTHLEHAANREAIGEAVTVIQA